MKLENLVWDRFKERPSECAIDSHALMTRGGYIKYVANGIFSSYTVLRRVTRKIEHIIREEMDALGGQEVLLPVVLPGSLWQESGRYQEDNRELVKFRDRNESLLLLGMTHEEAAVHLVREYGQSYVKYPFMVYQLQTKFRDEPRTRGGLLRVREFTMKDAYSFHSSPEDLENYFMRCYHAYERIFARVGLPQVISVTSDSGMMGGTMSYEFILPTSIGEDSIITCKSCDYRANIEAADSIIIGDATTDEKSIEGVICPQCNNPTLVIFRGIELGHIFQLGTKYTKPMQMSYLDDNGNTHYPMMGCYGIGIGRLSASICEVYHDDCGPIWPLSVAPWQVHLCCLRADYEQVKALADYLYCQLLSEKIEVIYDDRVTSAGVMFSDADLLGIPIRVIVSPRNMKDGCCEIVTREKSVNLKVKTDDIVVSLKKLICELSER